MCLLVRCDCRTKVKFRTALLQQTHRQKFNGRWFFALKDLTRERAAVSVPEIQAEELKQRLDHGDHVFLLDVRDEYEYEISNIGGHLIPLAQLSKRLDELDVREEIVAVCKMGPRGVKAVEYLQKHGFTKVSNLRGGLHAWSDRIDRNLPKY